MAQEKNKFNLDYLMNLAVLMGIEPKRGWKKKLSERVGLTDSGISTWLRRGIPDDKVLAIEKMGFPREKWMIHPAYTQPEEHMLPKTRGGDSRNMDSGSYGFPQDLPRDVTKIYEPEEGPLPSEALHGRKIRLRTLLDSIIDSHNEPLINAIQSNLEQFALLAGQTREVKSLYAKIERLENQLEKSDQRIQELEDRGHEREGPHTKEPGPSSGSSKDEIAESPKVSNGEA